MESSPGPSSVKSKSKRSVAKKKSKTISIQSLDLSQTFGLPAVPEEKPKPPRQERWVHRGDGPLLDADALPKGWNMNEPDLDPDDIDAQIARCKERIEDNIMPFAFEERLNEYTLRKQYITEIAQGEPEGLSVDLLFRIKCLKSMFQNLVKAGDPYKQIRNIRAILKAYREGSLHLNGLVTYWSHGDQLCQPRPFTWEEFDAINDAHEGHVGFWVEGLYDRDLLVRPHLILPYAERPGTFHYNMAFRVPGYPWWTELEMLYDTGSQAVMIFEGDVRSIMGPFGPPDHPPIRIIGDQHISGIGGEITCHVIALEVTVLDSNRKRLTPWIRVPVGLQPGNYNPAKNQIRCDGPFMSRYLYTASAPNEAGTMHFATNPASLRLPWMESRNAAGLKLSPEHNMGNLKVKDRNPRKIPRPMDMPDPGFRVKD